MFRHKYSAKTGNIAALAVLVAVALAVGCGGGVKITTTKHYDDNKKLTKVETKVEGSVEGQAVVQQGQAVSTVAANLQNLVASVQYVPGYDKDGKPLPPVIVRMPDSRIYDVLAKMVDFSKFESPSVKIFRQSVDFAKRAINPLAWAWAIGQAVSNAGNTTNTNTNYATKVDGQGAAVITPGSGNQIGISPVSQVTSGDQADIGDGNDDRTDNGVYDYGESD